ncbi:MAG TPA: hypothetical protein VFO10_24510 [Oligoflexus sp.]|uniref:hypothetical protein n=1 Tax=Oligoflexus sp. TaxID=1971216 RepID=UPI002D7F5A8A|nr:hypothetical protein [Oligoflexus sp.]HET9240450.1 hypothetical protein [Oligoflexus sp.]
MPSSSEILSQLSLLAQSYIWLAILWHLAVFALLVRKGWRPKQRHAAQLLLLPLISVSVLGWLHRNPFQGLVFIILTFILGLISFQLANRPVSLHRKWTFPVGILALLYALVYPHFLEGTSAWLYLLAAPIGVVPCPTLSLVCGFTLLFSGFYSRAWQAVCAVAGLFYAAFGIFVLGVWLDLGLLLITASMLLLMAERQELGFSHGNVMHS